MKRFAWMWAACLGLAAAAAAGEGAASALAGVKVGDWARYEMSRGMGDRTSPGGRMVMTVTEKTDAAVTLRIDVQTIARGEVAKTSRTATLDPAKPNDDAFLGVVFNALGADTNVKKETPKDEKIELAGKTFDSEMLVSTFSGRRGAEGTLRTWTSASFPFRLLKAEAAVTMERQGQKIAVTQKTVLAAFGDAEHPDPKANEEIAVPERGNRPAGAGAGPNVPGGARPGRN